MKRFICLLLTLSLILCTCLSLSACGDKVNAQNLMKGIKPKAVESYVADDEAAAVTDFSVRLFKATVKNDENTLVSPLSVLYALAMTANGASGDTKQEIENVLGLDTQKLNSFLKFYMDNLPQGEKYKLTLANSIWFNSGNGFTANDTFLQTNADYYDAEIYKTEFNRKTRDTINGWVSDKTDKMIPEIIKDMSPDAVMYLINALCFDAEWHELYEDIQVKDGTFTCEDGKETEAEFMHSTESVYLEDQFATGFIKPYKNAKYAFVALLPNEGVTVSDYVKTLNGEHIKTLLTSRNDDVYRTVYASIPKFETEYSNELSSVLADMGIKKAFSVNDADFSGLGSSQNGNLYINRVIHKTYITVNETGTRAGAATAVEMNCGAALPTDVKEVYLDRPFVYMLIDCENDIPFFIGTMMMP